MKISSNLNKVTPLSKIFAAVLFILFPFLGFYLGMNIIRVNCVNVNDLPYSVSKQLEKSSSSKKSNWSNYLNSEMAFSIKYPNDAVVVNEEKKENAWYLLISNDNNLLEQIKYKQANINNEFKGDSYSIQVYIYDSLKYEVPMSRGKVITINEDNLDQFHLGGPGEVEKGSLGGRPTLKSRQTTLNKQGNVTYSILDDKRLIRILLSSSNLNKYSYVFLDEILSSIIFI